MKDKKPWLGMHVVCLASGPSLTPEDVATVRAWRESDDRRRVIVVNTTFRAAPWADVLFAIDVKWWGEYLVEVQKNFAGKMFRPSPSPINWGISVAKVPHFNNSGAAAVSMAYTYGAAKIVLLGYDCQHTNGATHWHGDHPKALGNAKTVGKWPAKFKGLASYVRGCEVVNASRETALTCFKREPLEQCLR
jgi:hypothetical protein